MAENEQAWETKDSVCMGGIKGSCISKPLLSTLACSSPGPAHHSLSYLHIKFYSYFPEHVTSKCQGGLDGI